MVFIPDTTGLDLRDKNAAGSASFRGREQDYHGVAIHPRHLSFYERVVLKRHRYYDAELDRQQKMQELQALFQSSRNEKGDDDLPAEDMLEADLQLYFQSLADGQGAGKKLQQQDENAGQKHPSKLAEIEKRL